MAHFSTINSVTSANSNLVRGDDEDSNNNNNIVNFPPLADMFTKALDNMKETEELRKRYRDTTRVKFQELSRKLKSAQAKTERPPDLSEEAHHRQLDKIETENYNLRKSINKMEGEISSMESRIQTLKIEIEKLQNSKVEDEVIPQTDTTTMQLYVYHGLGIELTEEDDCLKARIQSSSTNDIYTVKIDDKLSPHFVANHIWDLAQ